ncbi:MAG: T9SS type A sorting domain-containing protein [Bacteroidetes bacterium]|nr:T9SS type A sorting domain-containing protein [Bacteroidota bacterium]
MNKNYLTLALAVGLLGVNAQNGRKFAGSAQGVQAAENKTSYVRCATQSPSTDWETLFQGKIQEFKNAHQNGKTTASTYNIPVVVHVIHTGQAVGTYPNIQQGQVNSQIQVLNADFAGTGMGSSSLPAPFAAVKANTGINFCLATKNPTGGVLPEPGIDRVNANNITASLGSFPSKNPGNSSYNSPTTFQNFIDGYIKPNTIWDPTRYMNVWVTDEYGFTTGTGAGLLGYATFPALTGTTMPGLSGGGTATTDGFWACAYVFGSKTIFPSGTYDPSNTYVYGRTATHEIGHWVGLRHIWGDAGQCGASDYCNDTPPQKGGTASPAGCNYGCPTYPSQPNTCTQGAFTNTNGDMFQNFMDYTDDNCMSLFTNDQSTRIQTAMNFGTYRSGLTASASSLCVISPATPTANFSMPSSACTSSAVTLSNSSSGFPSPTYLWSSTPSSGVSFAPSNTATSPNVTFSTPGSYVISVVATNSLGASTKTLSIVINTCSAGPSSTCKDTLSNIALSDSLNVFKGGADASTSGCSPNSGYIGGNNCYGDKEKAEFYAYSTYSAVPSQKIIGAIVLFFKNGTRGTGGNPASNVGLKIYGATSVSGNTLMPSGIAPGTLLSSTTVPMSSILAAPMVSNVVYCGNPALGFTSAIIKPYRFNFSSPVNAPASGGFFASVVLPTGANDTVAIFNSGVSTPLNRAYEMMSDNSWAEIKSDWGMSFNYNLAILPILDCTATGTVTGINTSANVLSSAVSLFPNPSNGIVSVIATLPSVETIEITVHNALGQLITSQKHLNVLNDVFNLNLEKEANGIYFISISNGSDKIVKRVILNK